MATVVRFNVGRLYIDGRALHAHEQPDDIKVISAKTAREAAMPVTRPRLVAQIDFSGAVLRVSTLGTVTWNSQTWVESAVDISGLDGTPVDQANVRLTFDNSSNAMSSLVLNSNVSGGNVEVYYLYGDDPFADGDGVLAFKGVIDAVEEINEMVVVINAVSTSKNRSNVPNVVIGPPLCNFLPKDGTVIYWGDETFNLERR